MDKNIKTPKSKPSPAKHLHGHEPQHSKTLMRQTVPRPAAAVKHRLRAVGPADAARRADSTIEIKHSAHQIDSHRVLHAKRVKQSALISHFPRVQPTMITPPVSVRNTPATGQNIPRVTRQVKQPQTTAELLQHALELATSHEQPGARSRPHYSRRFSRKLASRRITGISSLVVASFLLIGFTAYANSTSMRLHAASAHAGFVASLPSYRPAGYRLSHLNYRPGNVAVEFSSNSDSGRTYNITEQISNWDSQTLRDNFLALSGHEYQTVETASHTLYLYGQNNATWVSSGVWYQIKSNGALSAHQLVQLAGSM